jgi:hypothetical protein
MMVGDLTERDIRIFKLLWKWRVLSTKAIWAALFPENVIRTVYNRLARLRAGNWLTFYGNFGEREAIGGWGVTRRALHILKDEFPITYWGLLDEPGQSALVSAFHLGEWLRDCPPGVSRFSEHELNSYEPSQYPDWVPRLEFLPRGYWSIATQEGRVTVALEFPTKLDGKTRGRLLWTYRQVHAISYVIWVAHQNTTALVGIYNELMSASSCRKHHLICFEGFKSKGWQAPLLAGPYRGHSVGALLGWKPKAPMGSLIASPMRSSCEHMSSTSLDFRKCPYESKTYDEEEL